MVVMTITTILTVSWR